MAKVLVLGGYGGFGARLSRRLADDDWEVIVTGRNLDRATRLAYSLVGASALQIDRNADLAPILDKLRPLLVIDAAGPFQSSGYNVVEACIATGSHYCDLADSRQFVCGIEAFDHDARMAGITVISGASSVPALSQAVVDRLAEGMARLEQVDIAISASSKTIATPSVSAAALSYAGQAVRIWGGQRWQVQHGGQGLRRMTYKAGGKRLNRSVALADVPDIELGPARLRGNPSTTFRAGPDFRLQLFGLWALGWLVRWGWVKSLSPWLGAILPMQRLFGHFGTDRSAMSVEIAGRAGNRYERRCWNLVATKGDGPEVPVLAAQLLARKIREGQMTAGARTAAGEIPLGEFETLFAELAIETNVGKQEIVPLYRSVLGAEFELLPAPVRDLHDFIADAGASGVGTVERGTSSVARILAATMRFPPAGHYELHVDFEASGGKERWTRNFGDQRFSSELGSDATGVIERFGPLRFHFDLEVSPSGLRMVLRKWSAFRLPLPMSLAPRIAASELAEGADFLFDVAASWPIIGQVVHYRGRLQRN